MGKKTWMKRANERRRAELRGEQMRREIGERDIQRTVEERGGDASLADDQRRVNPLNIQNLH